MIFEKHKGRSNGEKEEDEEDKEEVKMPDEETAAIALLNQGLVHSIVKKYFRKVLQHVEYIELIQAGNIGLMKAIGKYDVDNSSKAKFYTYAFYWIRYQVSDGLKQNLNIIKLPWNETYSKFKEVDYEKVNMKMKGFGYEDKKAAREEFKKLIKETLTEQEYKIIQVRYKFDYDENYPKTMLALAKEMGYSKNVQVHKQLNIAKAKLKNLFENSEIKLEDLQD